MILRYLSVAGEEPAAFLILIGAFTFAILVGLTIHEFSHALAADRLGDGTPRAMGRLTLNPRAHLDTAGALMILVAGFGWARPTPVNPFNTRNPRQAMTLIAGAGPLSNLVIAGLAGLPIKIGLVQGSHPFIAPSLADDLARFATSSTGNLIGLFLGTVVVINVLLAVFNLLPLAPLDGFQVALGLLPPDLARPLARLEAWGPGLLILLILMPFLTGGEFSPLFTVMGPLIDFFLDLFVGGGLPIRFG